MAVNPKPEGYHSVTPYIVVEGAERLMDFLKEVFGAEETVRMPGTEGRGIAHAEARIGDSLVMLADPPAPERESFPAMLHIYVDDCDAVYKRALDAGATTKREPADQFYGDRMAGFRDTFGNEFWIATHVEDVSPEEMQRRSQEAAASPQA